ncbi:hypothetical protein [Azospirillum cavernae]|nr:hypothetical protein [Azospirillum cavernae]
MCIAKIDPSAFVHPTSLIGYGKVPEDPMITIMARARVEAFCIIEPGALIDEDVVIYHHCVVGRRAKIGKGTKFVDRVRVAADAIVGRDCIIGGNVSERVLIGDRVTFMGEMAHSHTDATIQWGVTQEVSPVIEEGCVIAQGAIIIGGIRVYRNSYISAGQIVKTDVPPNTFVVNGRMEPLSRWRGLIRARGGWIDGVYCEGQ